MKRTFLSGKKATAFFSRGLAATILAFGALIFATSCGEDEKVDPPVPAAASFVAQVDVFEVTFVNSSTGAVSSAWDFGDGNTSTELNVVHTYTSPGDYTVTLTVTGEAEDTDTAEEVVSIIIPESSFENGDFDLYPSDHEMYQANNDMWEPPTADDGWIGREGFRAGGMTTDGKKLDDGTKTNGLKIYGPERGAYQVVDVVPGATYVVTFEAATEVVDEPAVDLVSAYILSEEIKTEAAITEANTMAKVTVTSYPTAAKGEFQTYSMEFTATTDKVLFFLISDDPLVDGTREVWTDNYVIDFK